VAVSVTRGRVYLIQRGEVATNGTVARCIQGPAGLQPPGLAWRPAELAAPEVWDFTRHRPSRPEETRWRPGVIVAICVFPDRPGLAQRARRTPEPLPTLLQGPESRPASAAFQGK